MAGREGALRLTKVVPLFTRNHASLRPEVDRSQASVESSQGVGQDFVVRVCTGYGSFMHTHATSNCSWLNTVLADTELREESVEAYHIFLGEDAYSLRIDRVTTDKEQGDLRSTLSDGYDNGNEGLVAHFRLSPSALYFFNHIIIAFFTRSVISWNYFRNVVFGL